MKNKIIAALLGVLLIGTLGAAVVSAATSGDEKVNNSTGQDNIFGQMSAWCGKYMNSENFGSNACGFAQGSGGNAMNSGCGNFISSGNADGGFACH